MKKFLVIYHMPTDITWNPEDHSPEEMKKGMEEWMVWADKCGHGLLDMGNPLINGRNVDSSDNVSDSSKGAAGYSILQAADMDAALEMVKGHPHLKWNEACDLEVHEIRPMEQ